MIRTKGEPGTGDVVHAVQHMRQIVREIKALTVLGDEELYNAAKVHGAPYELIRMVAKAGKLPVPNFSAGGIATPADAALMMQLGAETVFVGSGIFMKEGAIPLDVEEQPGSSAPKPSPAPRPSSSPPLHFNDPKIVAEASRSRHRQHEGPRRRRHRREGPHANPRLVTRQECRVPHVSILRHGHRAKRDHFLPHPALTSHIHQEYPGTSRRTKRQRRDAIPAQGVALGMRAR